MENKIVRKLQRIAFENSSVWAVVGFDAVKDTVVRLVRKKNDDRKTRYFHTIEEFGRYLVSKKNMSCSLEMEMQEEKIGGNMAIFANSLGTLGVQMHCVGSMGYPQKDPLMEQISENCRIHTVCEMGQCNAIEFHDGKVMLSSMDSLKELNWENLTRRISQSTLREYFQDSRLAAMLNWSELEGATELFGKVYENCIAGGKEDREQNWFLMDISDASRKTSEELRRILKLEEQITRYRKTILSVNENEGRLIYKALFLKNPVHMEEMAERIGRALKIDYFILHLCDSSYGYQNGRLEFETGYYTAVPRISTGGGDNFNGGLCFGLLHGFSLKESLKLGNAVSGYYVRYGKSPNLSRLAAFLQEEPGRVKEEKVLRTESTGE